MTDIKELLKGIDRKTTRYTLQLDRMTQEKRYIENIKTTVERAIKNINVDQCKSFVIYGEPQSGKTEMMIALTARLLDEGFKIIIILLNDSVQLLNQNLDRFRRSRIDPAPKNFNEITDKNIEIGTNEWILFSKKNSKDLQKLISKLGVTDNKIIIDDEADYATPNSKINSKEKSIINNLVEKLIGKTGTYIGVTATPARLDLNNTFLNVNQKWVDFPPHPLYKGPDIFFPTPINNAPLEFTLVTFDDSKDLSICLRESLFDFLINVSYLNLRVNKEKEISYSILIHTSGKKIDHSHDYNEVVRIFNSLSNEDNANYVQYYDTLLEIANKLFPGDAEEIIKYIRSNINRNSVIVMNSDVEKNVVDYKAATTPSTLFTVAIGGNIVSRGVTFDNLLSMFFTRDVKNKIQQDTYIQRARMFGTRGLYLKFFELTIPEKLYLDWHRCFVFHKLSLDSIRSGNEYPVWLADKRIKPVAGSSIDKTTVFVDSGEMSFGKFDYTVEVKNIIESNDEVFIKLDKLAKELGDKKLPQYLLTYIKQFAPRGKDSVVIHPSRSIKGYKDANQSNIQRDRGFIGDFELEKSKYPDAVHHIKILYNSQNFARVFYKYEGNIKFIRNVKTT